MRKVLPFLGASLSVLAISLAAPSHAQDSKLFMDVPQSHWAYEAVSSLQTKQILLGYPDGYFRGKRPLTRYEFAIALDRALKTIVATPGPAGKDGAPGATGATGAQGEVGPPGVTPEELANFRRLATEFQAELAAIGANVKDINSRLDALSKDVADLRNQFNHLVKFSGDFFVGVRSDRSRTPFFDYSGAFRPVNPSHFSNVNAVHDFHLIAHANLAGGVKFTGDIVASNYLGYRAAGSNYFTGGVPLALGGPAGAGGTSPMEEVTVYQAQLDVPIGGFGSNTMLTVGRYKNQVTPLTYYRPDTDAYFDVPWYDDGNYIEDGFKLESKFGSAKTSIFAGSYRSLTTTSGLLINAPIVGANYNGNIFARKPVSLSLAGDQVTAGESAGVHVGLPLFRFGELGFTAIDFGNQQSLPVQGNFNNVMVYGVNLKLHQIGRFQIQAEGAKSVTQNGFASTGDNNINDDNNAFIANVGYNSGPVGATVGYQYIDPRFAAPGYWNKIGNWYNPTNISGPYARVTYNFSNALVGYLGADVYAGARNRPFIGGFTPGSNIGRATAGIKYNVNKMLNVNASYEGVQYDLSPSVSASGARAKPVEQYLTFGAGLNLASNTVLKFAYQIINGQDNGGGFGDVTGFAGAGGNVGHDVNATVFTTQLAVHF